MKYAVFITTIALDNKRKRPDCGISVKGLTTEQIVRAAQDSFAELNGQEGVSEPWIVNEFQLSLIEKWLPKEKY